LPLTDEHLFDVELVNSNIAQLKLGKAAGLDNITAEHLQHSHPVVRILLAKLFNLMFASSYVLQSYGYSYIVPIPKPKIIL